MAKIWRKQVPIYPVELIYCSCAKTLNDKYFLEHDSNDYEGFCHHKPGSREVVLHLPHDNGSIVLSHLVHECIHASGFMADRIGLNPTNRDNESVAYLSQWIAETVLELIDKECKSNASSRS
jgi:hypothetical protein